MHNDAIEPQALLLEDWSNHGSTGDLKHFMKQQMFREGFDMQRNHIFFWLEDLVKNLFAHQSTVYVVCFIVLSCTYHEESKSTKCFR